MSFAFIVKLKCIIKSPKTNIKQQIGYCSAVEKRKDGHGSARLAASRYNGIDNQHLPAIDANRFRVSKMGERIRSFEEGWPLLQPAVNRLINLIEQEGGEGEKRVEVDNGKSIWTPQERMSYYTIVYDLCTAGSLAQKNAELLHAQCKKIFDDYINFTVLPSLREKKDELLLRELIRRWSNHKRMVKSLSRLFGYLDREDMRIRGIPPLQETGFLSFYALVYDEMIKQVMEAMLALIDRKRAGEQIDQTLVDNALGVYTEIADSAMIKENASLAKQLFGRSCYAEHPAEKWLKGVEHLAQKLLKENSSFYYDNASNKMLFSSFNHNTPQDEEMHDSLTLSSQKINLISSEGDVFEVDYNVALMSRTIEDTIVNNPAGDINSISVSSVSSKMLTKVIEYCMKHSSGQMSDVDLRDWDVEFVNVDNETLCGLLLSANYMDIKSLRDLMCSKVADLIRKGKTPEEIS